MNKSKSSFLLPFLVAFVSFAFQNSLHAQDPWRKSQLMAPSELAAILTNEKAKAPLIISVSPEGMHGLKPGKGIKSAVEYGAADEQENLNQLKAALKNLPKDSHIVLYCGCCPFNVCPNVRPAFRLLNEMEFTNHQLLNLENNIRVDWMNKGYPMNK